MSIVLLLFCCCVAGAIFILVAPFILTAQFSVVQNNREGVLLFHWIHPWVAFVKYAIGSGTTELGMFGRTRTIPSRQATAGPEDVPPVREAAEQKPGPAAAPAFDDRIGRSSAIPQSSATLRQSTGPASDRAVPPPQTREKPEEQPTPKRLTWSRVKKAIGIIRRGRAIPKIFHWCRRLLRLLFRIIRFDHLRLHAAAGVHDPADTGKLFGYFTALQSAVFGKGNNIAISLEPRFGQTVLELEGSVGLKTSIAAIIFPAVVALLTFPYITVFFAWRRLKKV